MSNRDARPLSEKAMSAFHDACIEEIHQGMERRGIACLLGLHTGLRARLIVHFADDWREQQDGHEVIQTPKQLECTIREDGCDYCHQERSRGPDGFLRPKTGQSEQRTIPIFDTWYDHYREEKRETELQEWLDHWFKSHESGAGWGYQRSGWRAAVKNVAARRHDIISREHEGEEEATLSGVTSIYPDIIGHDLRATWTVQCLRTGVDDRTLMDWGGWADAQMIEHYRDFIGDPEGTERKKYESGNRGDDGDDNNDVDMEQVYEVYSAITEGHQVNPAEYDNAVLEAAYEMVNAS